MYYERRTRGFRDNTLLGGYDRVEVGFPVIEFGVGVARRPLRSVSADVVGIGSPALAA